MGTLLDRFDEHEGKIMVPRFLRLEVTWSSIWLSGFTPLSYRNQFSMIDSWKNYIDKGLFL